MLDDDFEHASCPGPDLTNLPQYAGLTAREALKADEVAMEEWRVIAWRFHHLWNARQAAKKAAAEEEQRNREAREAAAKQAFARSVVSVMKRQFMGCPQQAIVDKSDDENYAISCAILDNFEDNPLPADSPPLHPELVTPEDTEAWADARERSLRVGYLFTHNCERCGKDYDTNQKPNPPSAVGGWQRVHRCATCHRFLQVLAAHPQYNAPPPIAQHGGGSGASGKKRLDFSAESVLPSGSAQTGRARQQQPRQQQRARQQQPGQQRPGHKQPSAGWGKHPTWGRRNRQRQKQLRPRERPGRRRHGQELQADHRRRRRS